MHPITHLDEFATVEAIPDGFLRVQIGGETIPIATIMRPGSGRLRITTSAPHLVAGRRYRIDDTGIAALDGRTVTIPWPKWPRNSYPGLVFLAAAIEIPGELGSPLIGRGHLTMLVFTDDDFARIFGSQGGSGKDLHAKDAR
jgi:hypothetical protein